MVEKVTATVDGVTAEYDGQTFRCSCGCQPARNCEAVEALAGIVLDAHLVG